MEDLCALQPQEPPPPVYLMGEESQRGEVPAKALEWLKKLHALVAQVMCSSNEYPQEELKVEINNIGKFLQQQMCLAVRYNRVIYSLGFYERILSVDTSKILNSNVFLSRLRVLRAQ